MNKILFILLLIAILIFNYNLANRSSSFELPFDKNSVETVELYKFEGILTSHKKILDRKDYIEKIYDTISEIKVKKKSIEDFDAGLAIGIRFTLNSGDIHEYVYNQYTADKSLFITVDNTYQTKADLSYIYDKYIVTQIPIGEEDLLLYPQH